MNKDVFTTQTTPNNITTNDAGGTAYKMTDKHALCQLALTGCISGTYYAKASTQLDRVFEHAKNVDPEFLAKLAVYARTKGFMKDMPALLMAILASAGRPDLLRAAFPNALENGKMVKNFVQIIRSGRTGRKSLGSAPKGAIQEWFSRRTSENLLWDSIGGDVGLADVIQLAHPDPAKIGFPIKTAIGADGEVVTAHELIAEQRNQVFRYLQGKEFELDKLPEVYQAYERFKKDNTQPLPRVPFQLLTTFNLTTEQWKQIARQCSWQETRQSLNAFRRHGVFDDTEMIVTIADKLRNEELIQKAKLFPYQLLATYKAVLADGELPRPIIDALHDALEIATRNVPSFDTSVAVGIDVSGSMSSYAVTGQHGDKPASTIRAIDAAGLIAAVVLRNNPDAVIIPFDDACIPTNRLALEPRDTVMTNAQKLGSIRGGATRVAAPLNKLNNENAKHKLVIIVSDNESWAGGYSSHRNTETQTAWDRYKSRVPDAKLVLIDTTPADNSQAKERTDTLNVGGFSDNVFDVIGKFWRGELSPEHLVGEVNQVKL